MTKKDILEIFRFVDKNDDGVISRSEFIRAVEILKGEKGKGISNAYLTKFDANFDGVLSYPEFSEFCESSF